MTIIDKSRNTFILWIWMIMIIDFSVMVCEQNKKTTFESNETEPQSENRKEYGQQPKKEKMNGIEKQNKKIMFQNQTKKTIDRKKWSYLAIDFYFW